MKDLRTGRIGKKRHPLLLKMISEGKNASEIADELDVNTETVRKFCRIRNISLTKVDMSGDKHPSWKNGTTLDRSGYILRRVLVESEYGYLIRAVAKRGKSGTESAGYAPEHRILMHDHLGRKLAKGEVVDHIDGNKQNNEISNLKVYPSNAEHLKHTLKGKVPNWTKEGKARITGRPPKSRFASPLPQPIENHPRIDGQE